MTIASLPSDVWQLYIEYLVNYKRNSWVDSIASSCRVIAFATILPFIILMLLDVASYIIARTLGVIDQTKASTSGELETPGDKRTHTLRTDNFKPPTIVVEDRNGDTAHAAGTLHPPEPPEEDVDGNLKLSGVDTFSPAPSQPGSPTLQRREFMQHAPHFGYGHEYGYEVGPDSGSSFLLQGHDGRRVEEDDGGKRGDGDGDDEAGSGATTPRDPAGHGSGGSSSGESSYAIVDRNSDSEDAGVVLRRRTRQLGTGPATDDDAA